MVKEEAPLVFRDIRHGFLPVEQGCLEALHNEGDQFFGRGLRREGNRLMKCRGSVHSGFQDVEDGRQVYRSPFRQFGDQQSLLFQ